MINLTDELDRVEDAMLKLLRDPYPDEAELSKLDAEYTLLFKIYRSQNYRTPELQNYRITELQNGKPDGTD